MSSALPLWAENLAVFDTETTGIDTASARVVTSTVALIGAAGNVIERYDCMIDPGVEIPEAATRVHGISTATARQSGMNAAVGISQIIEQLTSMLDRGFPIVAYNAPFDLSLLRAEAARHDLPWPAEIGPVIDPLVLDKQFDKFRKGKRTLEVVAAHYGVALDLAHDAGEDAIAAGRIAQRIAKKYASVLPDQLSALHDAQVEWAAAQAADFEQYMRRVRDPNFRADGRWPLR